MSKPSSRLLRAVLLLTLVIVLLACFIGTEAAIYHPPHRPHKKELQELKVVYSNIHSLMFCRDCEDPLSEGSIGKTLI